MPLLQFLGACALRRKARPLDAGRKDRFQRVRGHPQWLELPILVVLFLLSHTLLQAKRSLPTARLNKQLAVVERLGHRSGLLGVLALRASLNAGHQKVS